MGTHCEGIWLGKKVLDADSFPSPLPFGLASLLGRVQPEEPIREDWDFQTNRA
jgi:hypothetical protein